MLAYLPCHRLGGRLAIALLLQSLLIAPHPKAAQAAEPPRQKPKQNLSLQVDLEISEVPEMNEWCERSKQVLVKWYPTLVEALKIEGYTPPHRVRLIFKKDMKGVAGTSGTRIVCAARWFKAHPDDVGALIHELVHVIQSYPKYDPPWLVEGIADYVRFWVYEPNVKQRRLDPARIRYQDSYRTTAAFLAWLVKTQDKEIVLKLNKACRKGQYKEALFKEYTGKDLNTLWEEFKNSLRQGEHR